MKHAMLLGTLAAFFFSSTFVLNHVLAMAGGNVFWLASLRYIWTVPMLLVVVKFRGQDPQFLRTFWSHLGPFIVWGTVGFGLFYLPLTWVASWAPAWLVAGTWQVTIIMGSLLVPLIETDPFQKRIPFRELLPSAVILVGVAVTEWVSHGTLGGKPLLAIAPIAVAAIAYPLGNRQMMRYTRSHLPQWSVWDRTMAMTLGSLPFWVVLMGIAQMKSGWPTVNVVWGSGAIALFSGVVATVLFFSATDSSQGNVSALARIEATQSLEILFTVLLGRLIFHEKWPSVFESAGLILIMLGMIIHSANVERRPNPPKPSASS